MPSLFWVEPKLTRNDPDNDLTGEARRTAQGNECAAETTSFPGGFADSCRYTENYSEM